MRGKTVLAVCALAMATATLSLADEWNRKIQFTFNKAVSIPAVHQPAWGVLPPGTYTFRIMDSAADRHIVQILNKEENHIYATILAIPNMRLEPTSEVVLTFRETPVGQPLALRAMFYPGRQWGEEFVYPKNQAAQIAKAVNEPVLSMPAELAKEEPMPEAPEIVAELREAPVAAVTPNEEELQISEVVTPPAPAALAEKPEVLPQTASMLFLISLLGFAALGGGVLVEMAESHIKR